MTKIEQDRLYRVTDISLSMNGFRVGDIVTATPSCLGIHAYQITRVSDNLYGFCNAEHLAAVKTEGETSSLTKADVADIKKVLSDLTELVGDIVDDTSLTAVKVTALEGKLADKASVASVDVLEKTVEALAEQLEKDTEAEETEESPEETATSKFKVGDVITGKPGATRYNITDSYMTRGVVTGLSDHGVITVKVIEHTRSLNQNCVGQEFPVKEEYFKKVDQPFKKGDKVKLLSGGGSAGLAGFSTGKEYTVTNPNYKNYAGTEFVEINGSGYSRKQDNRLLLLSAGAVEEYKAISFKDAMKLVIDGETVYADSYKDEFNLQTDLDLFDADDLADLKYINWFKKVTK